MTDRYQILEEINQGGVGIVLKAWDTKLQRHVAIKRFISPEQAAAASAQDRTGDLLKEAATLSSMHHPNIVSVFDVETTDLGPQVIMEYLNGQDLENAVSKAALTLEDFYMVAEQTLDALSNAHRLNLLHRDIKPSNIQVTWLANGKFVSKFVDFGLAKFFEKPSKQTVRSDGTVMGSIFYMAPEQFHRQALDQRSDIYSLGCVFYYALTMHRPFTGDSVQDVISAHLYGKPLPMRDYRPNVPSDLARWVDWLMSREPDARPANAETAMNALRQIMVGERPTGIPGYVPATQPQSTPHPSRTTGSTDRHSDASATRLNLPARKKKITPWYLSTGAITGAAAAFVASGLAFAMRGKEKPAARTEIDQSVEVAVQEASSGAAAIETGAPVMDHLFAWYDAGKGTLGEDGTSPAVHGRTVGTWNDQSSYGGIAAMDYTMGSGERKKLFPALASSTLAAGSSVLHPVLNYDGGRNLVMRDEVLMDGKPQEAVGDPMRDSLDGNVSLLIVARMGEPVAQKTLLQARGDKDDHWGIRTAAGGFAVSFGDKVEPSIRVPGSDHDYCIYSLVIDFSKKEAHSALINAAGNKRSVDHPLTVSRHKVKAIRLGSGNTPSKGEGWKGDIAELLIYDHAMPDTKRRLTEDYLRRKYFSSTGPTVTVR